MGKFDTHGGYFAPKDYFKVNAGGSHEENPNGGVQIGVDSQGVPNLLEEGEPVYQDFVFSDNIKADGGILEKLNIPKKYAGQLYSYIADKYIEEAELRPLDPISRNGLRAMLSRLAEAQETQKERNEIRKAKRQINKLSPDELIQLGDAVAQAQQPQQPVAPEMMQQPVAPVAPQPMMAAYGGLLRRYEPGGPLGGGYGGGGRGVDYDTYEGAVRDNTSTPFVSAQGYIPDYGKTPTVGRLDEGPMGMIPVVGDALSLGQAVRDINSGDYLSALMLPASIALGSAANKIATKGARKILPRLSAAARAEQEAVDKLIGKGAYNSGIRRSDIDIYNKMFDANESIDMDVFEKFRNFRKKQRIEADKENQIQRLKDAREARLTKPELDINALNEDVEYGFRTQEEVNKIIDDWNNTNHPILPIEAAKKAGIKWDRNKYINDESYAKKIDDIVKETHGLVHYGDLPFANGGLLRKFGDGTPGKVERRKPNWERIGGIGTGIVGGAVLGGLEGSAVPGIGTAAGAILGGISGGTMAADLYDQDYLGAALDLASFGAGKGLIAGGRQMLGKAAKATTPTLATFKSATKKAAAQAAKREARDKAVTTATEGVERAAKALSDNTKTLGEASETLTRLYTKSGNLTAAEKKAMKKAEDVYLKSQTAEKGLTQAVNKAQRDAAKAEVKRAVGNLGSNVANAAGKAVSGTKTAAKWMWDKPVGFIWDPTRGNAVGKSIRAGVDFTTIGNNIAHQISERQSAPEMADTSSGSGYDFSLEDIYANGGNLFERGSRIPKPGDPMFIGPVLNGDWRRRPNHGYVRTQFYTGENMPLNVANGYQDPRFRDMPQNIVPFASPWEAEANGLADSGYSEYADAEETLPYEDAVYTVTLPGTAPTTKTPVAKTSTRSSSRTSSVQVPAVTRKDLGPLLSPVAGTAVPPVATTNAPSGTPVTPNGVTFIPRILTPEELGADETDAVYMAKDAANEAYYNEIADRAVRDIESRIPQTVTDEGSQPTGVTPPLYSTLGRYAGALSNAAMAMYNIGQKPYKYDIFTAPVYYPEGYMPQRMQEYMPLDYATLLNSVRNQGNATARDIANAAAGPSTGRLLLSNGYNTANAEGAAFNQGLLSNWQQRNAVTAANNQALAQMANFDATLGARKAEALNRGALYDTRYDLQEQMLNNQERQQKLSSVSAPIEALTDIIAGNARENMAFNMANTNPALFWDIYKNGLLKYAPGANSAKCGGKVNRNKKK